MNFHRPNFIRMSVVPALLVLLGAVFAAPRISLAAGRRSDDRIAFRNARAETEQFIDYYSAIRRKMV